MTTFYIIFLVSMFLLYCYSCYRTLKKVNKIVSSRNMEIEKMEDELKTLERKCNILYTSIDQYNKGNNEGGELLYEGYKRISS